MKQTLTTEQSVQILLQDEYASWSYNGAFALCEYLDEIDPEMEMDVVAIRCDFHEYSCPLEAASAYGFKCTRESEALSYLQDKTTVVVFNGGIIVQEF